MYGHGLEEHWPGTGHWSWVGRTLARNRSLSCDEQVTVGKTNQLTEQNTVKTNPWLGLFPHKYFAGSWRIVFFFSKELI